MILLTDIAPINLIKKKTILFVFEKRTLAQYRETGIHRPKR